MTSQLSRAALLVAAVGAAGFGVAGFHGAGRHGDQEMIRAVLHVEPSEVAAGGAVTITLRVENDSAEPVLFEFVTSQRYDFLVTGVPGDTLWRWGEGRGYLQVLGQEQLDPGEALTYQESFEARLEPGRYLVTGVLAARNRPMQASAEFAVVERP